MAPRATRDDLHIADCLTIPEAGRLVGVARNQAYMLVRRGLLPTVTVAGRRLVRRSDAEALDRAGWWGRGRRTGGPARLRPGSASAR